ncbi:MAG: hypothetical protein EHM34_00320 [Nitrosopumilales archaeon]|nr:MAG: hypothetical protein EHM34_00320 [Nitrosopumilales archaeon]
MVHKKEKIHLQCGYEDQCKSKNCLRCPIKLALTNTKLTLAEAIAIEDFSVVDLDAWAAHSYGKSQRNLTQDIMRKMMKRIIWEKEGRWRRKIVAFFRFL